MWYQMDEGIRARIIDNVKSEVKIKALVYLLLIATVAVVIFFSAVNSDDADGFFSSLLPVFCILFVAVGLLAVIYIYFSTLREQSRVFNEAIYMTVGKVVSKGENNIVSVKLPGDKDIHRIKCENLFYKKAAADMRILVVSASKKNSMQMFGLEPSTYDKDGIL